MLCKKCEQIIKSNEEYLNDNNDIYHLNCYNCSNCQRSLGGLFYYRYQNPKIMNKKQILLCNECYYRLAPMCFFCLKLIDDIYLIYNEQIYHPNCFSCYYCHKPFHGEFIYPYENHVFCSNCYENIQDYFHVTSMNILTIRCEICRKLFEPGDLITKHHNKSMINTNEILENISYIHNSCFVCDICHENLSNSIYYSPNYYDDDRENFRFQCEKCHEISSSICYNCFKPSNDLMIIFNNRWYHDKCFQCKICHYQLKYFTRIIIESDGLVCERCFKSKYDRQETNF